MEPLSDAGYISDAEYECLYTEAHRIVRERYGDVSDPYVEGGRRLCLVHGVPTGEHRLFELCWNEDIARQMATERRATPHKTLN